MKKLFALVLMGLCAQSFCMNREIGPDMGYAQEGSALVNIDAINEASAGKDSPGGSAAVTADEVSMFFENIMQGVDQFNAIIDDYKNEIEQKNKAISVLEEENAALRGQVQKLESQLTRYRENLNSITLLIKGLRDNDLLGDAA